VGNYSLDKAGCCCCSGADNHGAFAPTRETGYTVGVAGTSFYGICNPVGCGAGDGIVIVGNVSGGGCAGCPPAATATYEIFTYTPNNVLGPATIPALLQDTGGTWASQGQFTVPAGLAALANPDFYGNVYPFNRGGSNLFRIDLISGGPIQVMHGSDPWSGWGGGSVIHASDGSPMGSDYWIHCGAGRNPRGTGCPTDTSVVDIFCPKTGMTVRGLSSDGFNSVYTTTGPDQCVAFKDITSAGSGAARRNWEFQLTGADGIALYSQCTRGEKGFTAPFLQTGDHYVIITPPVVYLGQSFWITVLVLAAGNKTKTDYCGTSSFTSTDPGAVIEGKAMDSYNYTWTSNQAPCTCSSNCDMGVKVFIKVTMTVLGYQTIVATDINDGSIVGITALQVVAADIKFTKQPPLQVSASGDIVQFK
ncbi:MAG: hypothetical protein AAB368_03980, partial [bacterium]